MVPESQRSAHIEATLQVLGQKSNTLITAMEKRNRTQQLDLLRESRDGPVIAPPPTAKALYRSMIQNSIRAWLNSEIAHHPAQLPKRTFSWTVDRGVVQRMVQIRFQVPILSLQFLDAPRQLQDSNVQHLLLFGLGKGPEFGKGKESGKQATGHGRHEHVSVSAGSILRPLPSPFPSK